MVSTAITSVFTFSFFVWKTSILSFILYYRIFTFAYGTIIWKVLEKVS